MKKAAAIKWNKDGQPLRCMIVDDSIYARKNLRFVIETFGGHVEGEAADGLAAVTEYDRVKTDIVLMDIIMPKMGGIDAAAIIPRRNPPALITPTPAPSIPPIFSLITPINAIPSLTT